MTLSSPNKFMSCCTLLSILNVALFAVSAYEWQNKFLDPVEEPFWLFSQYDSALPVVASALAFGAFFTGAFFIAMTHSGVNATIANKFVPNIAIGSAILGSLLTITVAGVMLGSGFGEAIPGWDQPEGTTERSVFGFVWGGMLTLATGTLAYSGYEALKPNTAKADTKPLL